MRSSTSFLGVLTCALVFFLALAPVAFAQVPNKPVPNKPTFSSSGGVLLSEGAVIDLDRSVLYLMSPAGKTEAVDLATDSSLWTSTANAKPLLLVEGQLLVQSEPDAAGKLALQVLDRESGTLARALTADLPAGVWATIEDGPRHSFRVWGTGAGADLGWSLTKTSEKPLQGYLPASEQSVAGDAGAEASKATSFERLEGSLSVDLVSGKVLARAAGVKRSAPWLDEGSFLPGVGDGRQFLSADGRHVLVSEHVSAREGYRWSLYSRAGELLGEVGNRFSVAPFLILGQTLILRSEPYAWISDGELVERSLALRAVDLGSGVELFAKALGSVEFAGPFPP